MIAEYNLFSPFFWNFIAIAVLSAFKCQKIIRGRDLLLTLHGEQLPYWIVHALFANEAGQCKQ